MKAIFTIEVDLADDLTGARVSIGCDHAPVPMEAAVVATEHMMTAVALRSDAGFERALELLVEGAKKNQVLMMDGIRTQ